MTALLLSQVAMETISRQGCMVGMSQGLPLLKSSRSLQITPSSISGFLSELEEADFIHLAGRVFRPSVLLSFISLHHWPLFFASDSCSLGAF